MRRHYRNIWSQAASRALSIAHTRAPAIRWAILVGLVATWFVAGFIGWYGGEDLESHTRIGLVDALYRTIIALAMSDLYIPASEGALNIARFAGLAVPVIGILFAFWGELGRSMAHALFARARNHIVICGDGREAMFLARVCRQAGDTVVLFGGAVADDVAWGLRKSGVFVFDSAGADRAGLRAARAPFAAHVVAFEEDDTANLQIEAAMQALMAKRRPRTPVAVHVATHSAMLLREAREMRSMEARRRAADARPKTDPKPFSLHENAARRLVQSEAAALLDLAERLHQPRVHFVLFGFDDAAQAVAGHVLKSLWSAHFEPPRLTVLCPDPADAQAVFNANHPEATAHPDLWTADIAFRPFDWRRAPVNQTLLESIQSERGAATALVVSVGADPENIRLAIALKRVCNHGGRWPAPIFMKETARSEFSSLYAKGDDTPELDAYLQAFGAHETTATRRDIIQNSLDQGAAIAHEHFRLGVAGKRGMAMKDLQIASRDWAEVLETFRAANRAVSDSAWVKIWDARWRPAEKGERGETAPEIPPDLLEQLARREHDRWVAERLLSGWKPAAERNNALMAHDKLVPWEMLAAEDREKDREQVRAAVDIARVMHPRGFAER
ncbi:MAG: RyR domain-containing protein [Hyphomonadaceae bacterium]